MTEQAASKTKWHKVGELDLLDFCRMMGHYDASEISHADVVTLDGALAKHTFVKHARINTALL